MPLDLTPAGEAWTPADLRRLTETMVQAMQAAIADCTDADVTLVPDDPQANDTYASDPSVVNLAWTLGHVIVHTTASAEEAAFAAAELARGVERPGRTRYELPWETITTVAQCRARLEESLRMRLASLELWPDPPHLETAFRYRPERPPLNAYERFVGGLRHDNSHIDQIRQIVQQGQERRAA
ncbi:MAG TPA: DinB family protein [Chloroflexia bacterium]|nr:DinB family protein [Chloroflexia bacterium]